MNIEHSTLNIQRDTALEALRLYRQRPPHPLVSRILEFARICRVENVMRPYLEAIWLYPRTSAPSAVKFFF